MKSSAKVNIIPKDRAVFWLDRNGRWHNQHGPFEHAKIIKYFNSAIRRDDDGYHLYQTTPFGAEKVYFPYEDCVLFAVDLVVADPITLILNTGNRVRLSPQKMMLKGDDLYMVSGQDRIKFNPRCLIKNSERITCEGECYFIEVAGEKHPIASDGDAA